MITDAELSQYIEFPVEGYKLELKTWIDPKSDKGLAKIVKACLALRNSDGGMLIIGLSNDGQLDEINRPQNGTEDFEQDYIQGLVSKYASIAFEVEVRIAYKNQSEIVVIIVPSGFKTPVASKRELKIDGNQILIRSNAVYVRTLLANNIVSTAEAAANDWDRIVSLCFENRESDIGSFIRRHLTPENIALLSKQIHIEKEQPINDPSILNIGYRAFLDAMGKVNMSLPDQGFFEASLLIQGQVLKTVEADQNFLNLIASANRRLTGWPFWVDSRSFSDRESHPYVLNNGWEALIESDFNGHRLDFWRIAPHGYFYAIRSLDDDGGSKEQPIPKTLLDPYLIVWRVAEVLTLAVAFAKALSYVSENSYIKVNLRWSGLEGRIMQHWSTSDFLFLSSAKSRQNFVESHLTLPIDVADSSIFQYVEAGTKQLFNLFGGGSLPTESIESICKKIISQRY